MSLLQRIRRFFERQSETSHDTDAGRIDAMTAAREFDALNQSDGGAIPPNYLPTGVDEGRPRK
jgi:hypothetical protein